MYYLVTVKPIRTEEDFEAAFKRIRQLGNPERGTPEFDEYDVLFTLAVAWEKEHDSPEIPTPIEAVRHALDLLNLKQVDIAPYFGSPGRVSEFMNGHRNLSIEQIKRLHAALRIPLDHLIGPI